MDTREQRGLVIAATCKLRKRSAIWLVPSQNQDGTRYEVLNHPENPRCTCPDFELRQTKCKHIHAVLFTIQREENPDGTTTVTERLTVSETVEKKTTYRQNWPAYNAAQSVEKDRFQELLFDLCRNLPEVAHNGRGRKPHTVKDSVFAMVFKVYSTFSARRFSSDLREALERGFLSRPIPGLKVPQFFENAEFTEVLIRLIVQSSLPLKEIETCFAIDSTGFGSNKFERWIDEKYGVPRKASVWNKVHIACGIKTNVVTAVRILEKTAADSPQFKPLLEETAKSFAVREMSADKAYASYENFEAVAAVGGEGFLAFKANTTGSKGGIFQKMFHYFQFRKEEFLAHYHKRSNVESTFSMIKRKFGDSVRSKTETAMVNECLCKLLAHNLCVLIQEQHELGIETVLWKNTVPVLQIHQS
jgi:transposase